MSLHIKTEYDDDIAKLVIMPGDPVRVKFIAENWTFIVIIISIIIKAIISVSDFLKKSKEERKAAAWSELSRIALSLVSDAESEWGSKTGEIKKSEVIKKIYDKLPALSEIANEAETSEQIDKIIDDALTQMREILKNKENE